MVSCTCSSHTVPVISWLAASKRLAQVPPDKRDKVKLAALDWLTKRHEGLSLYEGITSRDLTREEKNRIAAEVQPVADLPCPFREGNNCLLEGAMAGFEPMGDLAKHYGWLPLMVLHIWDRTVLNVLTRSKEIATTKTVFLTRNRDFPIVVNNT